MRLAIQTKGSVDVMDITDRVQGAVKETGVKDGAVTIHAIDDRAAVVTMRVTSDLQKRIAAYCTNDAHLCGSDLGAALLGKNQFIPIENGAITLGDGQRILFIDLHDGARSCTVVLETFFSVYE